MPDDYLWDRSGAPDAELQQLEQQLGKYKLQPKPLRSPRRPWVPLAIAAGFLLALAGGWLYWPAQPTDWMLNGSPIALGRTVSIQTVAEVEVGEIGRLRFQPGSRFRVLKSDATQKVMQLMEGSFDALIISDPYVFQVVTESARLDDLGCAYEVSVNRQGNGRVAVTSGWVRVNGKEEESLVRQGYEVDLLQGRPPSIPRKIAADSEVDALGLLHLLWRGTTPEDRAQAFDKLAAAYPPPSGVTRERALRGDPRMVKDYWPALNLGPEIQLPRVFLGQ
jgi:hypothetical protein